MGRGKIRIQPPPHTRRIDLAHVPDTSATTNGPPDSTLTKAKRNEAYEKVDPPFKNNESQSKIITWGEIGLIRKVALAIGSFFVFVVIPIVWFASSLNTNVSILQADIKDVKGKTGELVENSVKYSQRLGSLETQVSDISNNLFSRSKNSIEERENRKPVKP